MSKWKRFGVIVMFCESDHAPRHVHIFEDGKKMMKFDIENWVALKGDLSFKARRALEALRDEGAFDDRSKV